jgi:hypothetical protein
LSGEAAKPRASRAALRAGDFTSKRGLSCRRVVAPIKMASLSARTSSTLSKSASLDNSNRSEVLLSM